MSYIISDAALHLFYVSGEKIRRKSWPEGDFICSDGAEGGTIWYYCAEEDELTPDYRLGFHEIAADDWEFIS